MRTSQLHGAISNAVENDGCAWKRKSPAKITTFCTHSIGKLSFQNPVTATLEEVEELRPERKAASDEQREELEARS
jgi:hypothetical protein